MELEKYNVERNTNVFVYEFYSEGPRGRIKKAVEFQYLPAFGRNFFNLTLGI